MEPTAYDGATNHGETNMTLPAISNDAHLKALRAEIRHLRALLDEAQGRVSVLTYAGLTAVNCLADRPDDQKRVSELLKAAE